MPRWMINCKDVAALVSEGLDRPLSFWDKVNIKIHLMMCPPCHRVRAQLSSIREACRWIPDNDTDADSANCFLPDEARSIIKSAIKKHCA